MIRASLAALLLIAPAAAQDLLIRGATIHPVTAARIDGALLLIQDGKIAEIGPKIKAPKGVKTLDARGLHVYPGLIDSATAIGLHEISSVTESLDTAELGDFNPHLRAVSSVNPSSDHIPVTRANGLTTVMTLPSGGVISGQGALIHLDGWTWEEMAVLPSAAIRLNFPRRRGGGGSRGRGREAEQSQADADRELRARRAALDEFFESARRYKAAKEAGGSGFRRDLKLESMLPVIDKKLPVIIVAERASTVKAALDFIEKEKIRGVLAGVREAGDQVERIKKLGVPVIVAQVHALPLDEDNAYDSQYTLPGELHRAGIKIAFGSFDVSFARNLPFQVAAAAAFGLPQEEALKALTINPAEIWGVADRIGSIETGKWADLIITSGDPLETQTRTAHMLIRGKEVSLENKHTQLYKQYMSRP
jgi:imidazolonepropionase-like amidohydrolase